MCSRWRSFDGSLRKRTSKVRAIRLVSRSRPHRVAFGGRRPVARLLRNLLSRTPASLPDNSACTGKLRKLYKARGFWLPTARKNPFFAGAVRGPPLPRGARGERETRRG